MIVSLFQGGSWWDRGARPCPAPCSKRKHPTTRRVRIIRIVGRLNLSCDQRCDGAPLQNMLGSGVFSDTVWVSDFCWDSMGRDNKSWKHGCWKSTWQILLQAWRDRIQGFLQHHQLHHSPAPLALTSPGQVLQVIHVNLDRGNRGIPCAVILGKAIHMLVTTSIAPWSVKCVIPANLNSPVWSEIL